MEVGDVMVGGTVSIVEESTLPEYQKGELVLGYGGWQDFSVSDGVGLTRIDTQKHHPSLALGVIGMPGFTAYMGLTDIGQPKSGETVVVGAASGAVGSVVGQVARLKGCRSVGIAGGPEKCRFVVEELQFDACIDHHAPDFPEQLRKACPNGIDIYFESVGGTIFDTVLPLLNTKARVPVCGLIANYCATGESNHPDRMNDFMRSILTKRIRMQGFIIFNDYGEHFPNFYRQMSSWLWEGAIKYREDMVDGLENAPQAFLGLFKGGNFGKLVIRVANT
jgi:hypothetical protein